MLSRIFPKQFDNNYSGSKIALFIFAPIVLFKAIMGFNIGGLNPLISAKHILEKVDGVPISTYPIEAANSVIFSSMAWGMMLLTLCLISIIALFRYRSMIPILFLALLFEQIGRKWIGHKLYQTPLFDFTDLSTAATINWALTFALLIGFAISLFTTKRR